MEDPMVHKPVFCEGCPMRGDVELAIETIHVEDLRYGRKKHWRKLGAWAVLGDADKNQSEPIRIPDTRHITDDDPETARVFKNLSDEITACDGPDMKDGIIFKNRQRIVGCHALKGLSLDDALNFDDGTEDLYEGIRNRMMMNGRLDHFKAEKQDIDDELRDILRKDK